MTDLSEEDVKLRLITPALEKAGWRKEHIRMEYFFTDGQILVEGKKTRRGYRKKADYLLLKNGIFPLGIGTSTGYELRTNFACAFRFFFQR